MSFFFLQQFRSFIQEMSHFVYESLGSAHLVTAFPRLTVMVAIWSYDFRPEINLVSSHVVCSCDKIVPQQPKSTTLNVSTASPSALDNKASHCHWLELFYADVSIIKCNLGRPMSSVKLLNKG